MHIGLEGDGDKTYIVVQFDDGQRAVKGPVTEEQAREIIDGMLAEMKEEGFNASAISSGSRLPQGAVWVGTAVTCAFLIWLLLEVLR